MVDTPPLPLSIVVPVYNGETHLGKTLEAIVASDLLRTSYELIVVDDASSDGSPEIADRYADTVLRIAGQPRGPAYARNRGAERARGDAVAFIDADVVVRPDTLSRMLAALSEKPACSAVVASYDAAPAAPNFLSQYWNLLLHFGAQRHIASDSHFAAACALVRRSSLVAAGMFNEWLFRTSGLEDVELGQRLLESGHPVLQRPDIQVTHLRQWDLRAVLSTVWYRSALLARCLGFTRTRAAARAEVVHTLSSIGGLAGAAITVLVLSAAVRPHPAGAVTIPVAIALLLVANHPIHAFFLRSRGLLFALSVVPVHALTQVVGFAALGTGWVLGHVLGDPVPDATTQAYAEVGVEMWPPVPRRRK